MPKIPNVPAFELPPDWVCEVVSPRTAKVDRTQKMTVYARVHIPHLWMVDPIARTLEVFQLQNGVWAQIQAFARSRSTLSCSIFRVGG